MKFLDKVTEIISGNGSKSGISKDRVIREVERYKAKQIAEEEKTIVLNEKIFSLKKINDARDEAVRAKQSRIQAEADLRKEKQRYSQAHPSLFSMIAKNLSKANKGSKSKTSSGKRVLTFN